MADVLPGFVFSRNSQRYRDLSTGRYVARADILGLLDTQTATLEQRLANLTTAVYEGRLAPAYYAEQMRTELRRGHLQNRALGVGGFDKLTQADYGSVGRKLRDDYARIANLAQGLADGTVTLPQALNRINGYAGNARTQYFEADKRARHEGASGRGMTLLMIRDLGPAEHCPDCLSYYTQGWQYDLPLPCEASQCNTHCRCSVRYKEIATEMAGDWIGRRG